MGKLIPCVACVAGRRSPNSTQSGGESRHLENPGIPKDLESFKLDFVLVPIHNLSLSLKEHHPDNGSSDRTSPDPAGLICSGFDGPCDFSLVTHMG